MKTPNIEDAPSLPPGVAEAWFHISAGGEVYTSRVCRGHDLLKVLDELAPGLDGFAKDLADPDAWHVVSGRCVSITLAVGEESLDVSMIDDRGFSALAEHCDSLRKLLLGFVQLTNHEAKAGGWRVTLEYDNYHDGARVLDGDGKLIAECYEDMGGEDTDQGDRQCIEAMRRAASGIKPTVT